MQVTRSPFVIAIVVLAGLASCKAKQYPDSSDGLVDLIRDIRGGTTPSASVKLADTKAWFSDTFGDPALAAQLAADLDTKLAQDLQVALQHLAEKGKTEIRAERFTDPEDPNASGTESFALKHARKPLRLYSVRITPPNKHLGIHLYSFVYVDGAFRFVGPMTLLRPAKPGDDPVMAAVYELRNKDREAYFKTGKLPEDDD